MTTRVPHEIEIQPLESWLAEYELIHGRSADDAAIERYKRYATGRCHDCGVARGSLHIVGCDAEVCEQCQKQKISCGCNIGSGL